MNTAINFDSAPASQTCFRALMNAMARPGTVHRLPGTPAPEPLMPAAAALIRSLADYETPIWCDAIFSAAREACDWIKFHTGAPLTRQAREACFALIADPRQMPLFSDFALGSEEYPDRSTTIIMQIEGFSGTPFELKGPGIKGERAFAASRLPYDFPLRLAENRALFPRGVDVILVAGDEIAALPRTVRIQAARD